MKLIEKKERPLPTLIVYRNDSAGGWGPQLRAVARSFLNLHIPEPGRDSVFPTPAETLPPTTQLTVPHTCQACIQAEEEGLRAHPQTLGNGCLLNHVFAMLLLPKLRS